LFFLFGNFSPRGRFRTVVTMPSIHNFFQLVHKSCIYRLILLPCFLVFLACGVSCGGDHLNVKGEQSYPVEKIYPHPTEDLGLVLMGTIVGKADTGVAIILVKSDGRQVLRRQGERVNGAEVVDIQWDHVILNIAGNRYLLDMKETANYRIAAPSAEIDSMMQEEAGRNMEAGSSEQHESTPEEHLSPSVEPVDPLLPQRIRMEFPVESAEQQGQ
jgi:hypothetical protein